MNTTTRSDPLGSAWMVVAALLFTLMGIWVKQAGSRFGMNPYELVFWRVAFSAAVLGGHAAVCGRRFATPYPQLHFWRGLAGSGGLLLGFYGLTRLPLATAITLMYTTPVFMALLSLLLLKERLPPRTWGALLLGLAGIAVLLQPVFDSRLLQPALITLGCGLCAAFAYLQVGELARAGEPDWRIVFYFSLLAAVVSAVPATFVGWTALSWHNIPYILGIGCSAMLAQLALTRAYRVGRKFTVASLSYLTVLFSALYGWLVAGEGLGLPESIGMAMIIAAGVVSSRKS